ncbi:RTA1 like protein [Aspergillus piperis CBS 112811]|uniref:RTA1 like protein n=1 Tax=Aspergillus piperis CBS 112811 TaxID=1448313 RepID=A0A8G1RCI1_9EURO|nr:RTA1 like protein [Aspergillus piperis CBS 112811]XP_025520454.1 RTA1 like protein [Aspergillus piperis CBS 112811]RAH62520.1 RTA1 like protein [Aspergillus piperis CBS 112811]RAH62532.1 RTA1 like protein [Aspergillus piperis CBS 112811]
MGLAIRSGFEYYYYYPSLAAAVIFIICFVLTTLLHTFQLIRTKTWFFIPFLIGGYFEFVGYCARAVSSNQSPNWTLGPFLINSLLPLVAPALFAASIYMELGRLIVVLHAQNYSLIRVKWLTKIFVTGDVLSFLLQAGGAGLMGTHSQSGAQNGSHIIVVGLVVQIVFFGFFIITTAIFHRRMLQNPTPYSLEINWKKLIWVLYSASVLILVRSIYRLIEYIEGFGGYLLSHEAYLYVFDALLMFAVMLIFHVVHPSELNAWLKSGGLVSKGFRFERLNGNAIPIS